MQKPLLWKPIILLLLLALPACTSAGKQEYAGITEITMEAREGHLPTLTYKSGKEATGLTATYERMADGVRVTVGAESVQAFKGQEIQAEFLKLRASEQYETIRAIAPNLMSLVCKAALGSVTVGAGALAC